MSDTRTSTSFPRPAHQLRWRDHLRRAVFTRALSGIATGRLELTLPDHTCLSFGDRDAEPYAALHLRSWRSIDRILRGGDMGLAEGYMAGEWHTPDLGALFDLIIANEDMMSARLSESLLVRALNKLRHLMNSNTRRGSRQNIAFHYDLGNDFYAQWLDRGMTYSAAQFETADMELEAAQTNKYRRICQSLGLKPGQSILEIGCGWGGFAELAAREFGAIVHGVTLSIEQLAYARQRIASTGLDEAVTFDLTDYRDVEGAYDHIVSIEMFEAVGQAYWTSFFEGLQALLKPGGRVFLQVITIDDDRFEGYARQPDFIQRYIFPGGMLPSPERLDHMFGAAGFEQLETVYAGDDYARTIEKWRHAFHAAWPRVAALGFDNRFKNLWDYYLHYCEAGFRHNTIDLGRFVLARDPRDPRDQ